MGGMKYFAELRGPQNVWRFTGGSKYLLGYSNSNMFVNTIQHDKAMVGGGGCIFHAFDGGSMNIFGTFEGVVIFFTITKHFNRLPSLNC